MSETQEYIGKVHNKDLARDAIHIAVVQGVANEELEAGNDVGFVNGPASYVTRYSNRLIGIVDPYLKSKVDRGMKFYIHLYPNTITSLNHSWTHPAFASETEKSESEKWLRELLDSSYGKAEDDEWGNAFKGDSEFDRYDETIERFKSGEVINYFYGTDVSDAYNADKDNFRKKFWDNLEIVTGVAATKEQRAQEWFSCSC